MADSGLEERRGVGVKPGQFGHRSYDEVPDAVLSYVRVGPHEPVAYTYEAGIHCPACTLKRFGVSESGFIADGSEDNEGNEVGAVFPTDEVRTGECCESCGDKIEGASEIDEDEEFVVGCDECTDGYSFYLGRNWPCQYCNAEDEDTLEPEELFHQGPGPLAAQLEWELEAGI